MKEKQNKRFVEFFEGKGFYIILILCLMAIGVSAYVLFFGNQPEIPEIPVNDYLTSEPSWTPPPLESMGEGSRPVSGVTDIPEPSPERVTEPEPSEAEAVMAAVTQAPTAAPTPEPLVFVWPVKGEIITPFSLIPIENGTMGDLRAHRGVDIASPLNTKVGAMTNGKVLEVSNDYHYGMTVTIDHGNGLIGIYRNLNKQPAVKQGAQVKAGDIIGNVSDTANAEIGIAPHLHFEVTKNGEYVNPLEYLPS